MAVQGIRRDVPFFNSLSHKFTSEIEELYFFQSIMGALWDYCEHGSESFEIRRLVVTHLVIERDLMLSFLR